MIRRPPRSTQSRSSAASDVYKRQVFWPRRPGRELTPAATVEETPDEQVGRPVRSRALRLASARPALTVAACLLVLGAGATGLARLEVGQTLMRGLPADAEPRRAYAAASQGFAPGILSPTVLIVEQPPDRGRPELSLIHISEPTRLRRISY